MRGTRGLLLAVLALGAGVLGIPSASPARADSTPQLEAERAQLLAELAAMTPAREAASAALSSAEAAYTRESAALTQARTQLAALNSQLDALATEISTDRAQQANASSTLAALTRATYESATDNTMVAAVLNARDFTAAMNSLSGASAVTTEIEGLETTLDHDQADLVIKESSLRADLAQASMLENQLSDEDDQMMVIVFERDQVVKQLSGPARQIAIEIAQIDDELSSTGATSSGSCGNDFAFGECTWYVATQRCIPWGGNADAWYYNAAQMGYQEGSTPEVGAVAVWWAGRGGASWVGHVAYVVAVGPTAGIPAGSFELAEMNWDGWDRVDYRIVVADPNVFQGFIYGK